MTVMSEVVRDLLLVAAIGFGALMQRFLGGPWLLMMGSAALGVRLAFTADDRRAAWITVGSCAIWYVLHWIVGKDLERIGHPQGFIQLASEAFIFLAFPPLFWIARVLNKERVDKELRRLEELKSSKSTMVGILDNVRQELEKLTEESESWTRLFSVTKEVGEVIRAEEMASIIKETVRAHLKLPAYVLLVARDGMLRCTSQLGFEDKEFEGVTFPIGTSSTASWFLRQREPVLVDDVTEDGRFTGIVSSYKALMAIPLRVQEEPMGVLIAFDAKPRTFSRQDLRRAWILGRQLALGVGKAMLYEWVEELSITDGLTKLYRHRYFQERLSEEMERARRYDRPLSLLMADLDHFKNYNDTYGHLEGDSVLAFVARTMERQFSQPAILARYGGEEFAVLMPGFIKESAVMSAERFREALMGTPRPSSEAKAPVTISVGVASFPQDAQTVRDLISRADMALYRAKSDGRNCVREFDAEMMENS